MKKIVAASYLFFGLTASFLLHAQAPDCSEFIITLQNNTSYDCTLKSSQILNGKLFENASIPDVVFRDQKMSFIMSQESHWDPKKKGLHGASVYLRYQCGDNQEISLFSYMPGEPVRRPKDYLMDVIGSVLDAQHIKVFSAQKNPSDCSIFYAAAPASLTWVLNDGDD